MIETSNEDIFTWVIDLEDKALKELREKVISDTEYVFGIRGRKIAEKYYRQIDGEDDYDITEIDTNCNDCKERAKKLIENAEFTKTVLEILTDDKISQLTKNVDITIDIKNFISNRILSKIISDSLFEIDQETKNKIISRILLESCKKIQQNNDNCSG